MNTLALCRFSFKRPANIKTFIHTLDKTVSEISKKQYFSVLDTHICTCTAVAKRHLPALQR